jgi:hypothetical protein
MLLHDTMRQHIATRTLALLEHFDWELFDHSHHSTNLPPSDNLFTYLKNWLISPRLNSNEKLMGGVKTWLPAQAADFFGRGIHKLILR